MICLVIDSLDIEQMFFVRLKNFSIDLAFKDTYVDSSFTSSPSYLLPSGEVAVY